MYYVGVDLGGTKILAAIVNTDYEIIGKIPFLENTGLNIPLFQNFQN